MGCLDPAVACTHTVQPGLSRLASFTTRYGGVILGIENCRQTRSGSGLSVHAEGRALDWYFPNRTALEAYFKVLIDNSTALNIQAIHDYDKSLRWTCEHRAWYKASIGVAPHHNETHVERNWKGARDSRAITDIIAGVPAIPDQAAVGLIYTAGKAAMSATIPCYHPTNKAGSLAAAGGRAAFYTHTDNVIVMWNGAAIAGDQAWPLDPSGRPWPDKDKASIEGKTFRAIGVPVLPGHKIVGLSHGFKGFDSAGQVLLDYSKVVAYATDGGVFVYEAT